MKRRSMFCVLVLFGLLACDEENVPTNGSEFDAALVGYWYRLETDREPAWTGHLYHHAFYISADGQYQSAGVEIATGNIDLMPPTQSVRIHFAHAGRIGLDWFRAPGGEWDTISYQVDRDMVSISGSSPISGLWTRKLHREKVTDALDVRFTMQMDGVETSIPSIAPDAGAGVSCGSRFRLSAHFVYGHLHRGINITVPGFHGPGTYSIGTKEAWYSTLDGDVITYYNTDSLYTGSITINTYDTQTNRCSGSFDVTMGRYEGWNRPPTIFRFSNGRFSVPIF